VSVGVVAATPALVAPVPHNNRRVVAQPRHLSREGNAMNGVRVDAGRGMRTCEKEEEEEEEVGRGGVACTWIHDMACASEVCEFAETLVK
jgi:hypothetical protein